MKGAINLETFNIGLMSISLLPGQESNESRSGERKSKNSALIFRIRPKSLLDRGG